jgi:hypothetical protein
MDVKVLVPFEQAEFLYDVIKDLNRMKDDDCRGYDDYSDDWYKGFNVGISNAIYLIDRAIKKSKENDADRI